VQAIRLAAFAVILILAVPACQREPDDGALASASSLSEVAGTAAPVIPAPPALDADAVALGSALYAEHCAACHGARLEGEGAWKERNEDGSFRAPPHDATGHTWHHSDDQLREAVLRGGARLPADIGQSEMPTFADTLSLSEVDAVLAYIKSNWPEEIRAVQWEQTMRQTGGS
jgi:mono/diheme cytochrome c family protein